MEPTIALDLTCLFNASADVYGRKVTAREIVLGGKVAVPASGRLLVSVLQKNAPHNESAKASNR